MWEQASFQRPRERFCLRWVMRLLLDTIGENNCERRLVISHAKRCNVLLNPLIE